MFSFIKNWFSSKKEISKPTNRSGDIVLDCPAFLFRYDRVNNLVVVNVCWPKSYPKDSLLKVIPGMMADLESGTYHSIICATIADFCMKNGITKFGEELLTEIHEIYDGDNLLKMNDLAMLPCDVFKADNKTQS